MSFANIQRYAMRNIKLKPVAQLTLQEIKDLTERIKILAESMWEGCDGCDETDKQMWINGFITGYLTAKTE